MSRLIETIRLEDGHFENLAYHERRMAEALRALYDHARGVDLDAWLRQSYYPVSGLHRCRVVYDATTTCEVGYWPYTPRPVRTLRLVVDDAIDYAYKFEDRSALETLVDRRDGCDDILIVRNGWVTDCSYANLAFRKGQTWFTPDTPLLPGTMRQKLIDEGILRTTGIRPSDLPSFDSWRLVNAMLRFESPEIDVSNIVF